MDQKEFWKSRWKNPQRKAPNDFAKRCFKLIKNNNLKTILDLGCGSGTDSIYFAEKGLKVTAVDFSESAIKYLKKEIENKNIENISVLNKDIRNLDFKDSSFDIIYAHLSLHYFDDKTTTKIFDELYRILGKNGTIFIKCKSTEDAKYGQGEKIEENMYMLDSHIRHFFSKEYMKEKLGKFKILKIGKTSSTYSDNYKSSFIEAIAAK